MRERSARRRRLAVRLTAVVAAALAVASVWYVQAPPRTAQAYREEAGRTAETLSSQLATARLWVRAVRTGAVTRAAGTVGFQEAESDATAAASSFAAHDPPSGTDPLRRRLTRLGDEVTSTLSELRVVAHRGQWDQLPDRAGSLERLSRELRALAREVRP